MHEGRQYIIVQLRDGLAAMALPVEGGAAAGSALEVELETDLGQAARLEPQRRQVDVRRGKGIDGVLLSRHGVRVEHVVDVEIRPQGSTGVNGEDLPDPEVDLVEPVSEDRPRRDDVRRGRAERRAPP